MFLHLNYEREGYSLIVRVFSRGCRVPRTKDIRENQIPARKAVEAPENVPINRMGIPSVNNMSHSSCVRATYRGVSILQRMMRYPRAAMNDIKIISIIL